MTNNMNLFRELEPGEVATFRDWARRHYKPGEPINGVWHPVIQAECVQMNKEAFCRAWSEDTRASNGIAKPRSEQA